MKKILCLLFILALAVGSIVGYTILNRLIIEGSLKIAAGELQIKQGEQALANGKERLARGEHKLSQGKKIYSGMNSASILGVAGFIAPPLAAVTVVTSHYTRSKISSGEKQVKEGKKKIASGERKLAQGKKLLRRGIERLEHAKWIRLSCGLGSIFFTTLFIVLLFYWRRSLIMMRRKSHR